jgi:phosphatidate cytidylyltransferase
MLVDYYLQILHFDRRMPLNIDLGPLHIHLYARAVFFMWVTVAILVIGGIAVLVSRRRERPGYGRAICPPRPTPGANHLCA